MAELLLRVGDKINTDFYLNTKCTKRGDVIVAQDDGWVWGNDEKTLPFYRILKIPAMTLVQAESFLSPELDVDPNNPSKTLQRRVAKLDLDSLPAQYLPLVDPTTRTFIYITIKETGSNDLANGIVVITINTIMNTLKKIKSPIADPAIIGT